MTRYGYRTKRGVRIYHRVCFGCRLWYNTTSTMKTFFCSACQHQRSNPRDAQIKGKNWFGWIRQRKLEAYFKLFGVYP